MRKNKRRKKAVPAVGGARIKVSLSVILMAAIAMVTGHIRETFSYAAAVILHEFSHATVAARLGYKLDTVKIMPYGAALTGEFETARPKEEFLIALAGPLSNLVFATVFTAVWWLVPSLFYYTEIYVTANVFTALVNILPVFPLDGGRGLLALLSVKFPREKVYKALRIVGFIVGGAGLVLSVVFFKLLNFSYFTFLIFILVSAFFPDKSAAYRRLYGMSHRMEKIKSGLTVREIMIHKDTLLIKCAKLLNPDYYSRFIVIDDTMKKLGELDESELEDCLVRLSPSCTVCDALIKTGRTNESS